MFGVIAMVAVLALIGWGVWAYQRNKWIKSLTAKGWQFTANPGREVLFGLNCPPFGIGYKRRVDDLVSGTTSDGSEFRSFRYTSDAGTFQVAVMPLPTALPELHLSFGPSEVWRQITCPAVDGLAAGVRSTVPEFAQAVAPVMAWAVRGGDLVRHLVIDGRQLVSVDVSRDADPLQAQLEQLAGVRQALLAQRLEGWPTPVVPSELSVYGRPHWSYRERDDRVLDRVIHDTGGSRHEARHVVFGELAGFAWIALEHHWITTHTTTDSEGRSRTETRHHEEKIMEITAPSGWPDFSINKFSLFRQKSTFESIDFNSDFKVRCVEPRFAHDVIHPRMMEYLQQTRPRGFEIEHGRFRLDYDGKWADIDRHLTWVEGFLQRVPRFVWQNLGYAEAPLALH